MEGQVSRNGENFRISMVLVNPFCGVSRHWKKLPCWLFVLPKQMPDWRLTPFTGHCYSREVPLGDGPHHGTSASGIVLVRPPGRAQHNLRPRRQLVNCPKSPRTG